MALISVTFEQLKVKADELQKLNNDFKTSVSELEGIENELASMWEGMSRDTFHNAFNSDKSQMDNFYNVMEQYVQALLVSLAKYQQAESQNVETAATRTYR